MHTSHLDSYNDPHPKKWNTDLFREHFKAGHHIRQLYGFLIKDELKILNLYMEKEGHPTGHIIHWTSRCYTGNRNYEPRAFLFMRIKLQNGRNVLVGSTHLTTQTGENEPSSEGRTYDQECVNIRKSQISWIVDYIISYKAERQRLCSQRDEAYIDEPLILMGDFNATSEELRHTRLHELGIRRVEPRGPTFSHRTHKIMIDHIFASDSLPCISAEVIDLKQYEGEDDRIISDHLPIKATFSFPL